MSAALKNWLQQMRVLMGKTTAAVLSTTVHSNFVQAPYPADVLSGLRSMRSFQHALMIASVSGKAWGTESPSASTLSVYLSLVDTYNTFLTALLPQLNQLGLRLSATGVDCSIGRTGEDWFWELWGVLIAGVLVFGVATDACPKLSPVAHKPSHNALYASYKATAQWLLSVLRTPAWALMRSEHGVLSRNNEVRLILEQMSIFLNNADQESTQALLGMISSHPPTLLSLVCCIISDNFSTLPRIGQSSSSEPDALPTIYRPSIFNIHWNVPFRHQLLNLTQVIQQTTIEACANLELGTTSFLITPALLQFLKIMIISPCQLLPCKLGTWETCTEMLLNLLHLYQERTVSNAIEAAPDQADLESSLDSAGLPHHLDPRISIAALETDTRLLHALSCHMDGVDAYHHHVLYSLQHSVVRGWGDSESPFPISTTAADLMARSVVGLVKQCIAQSLHLMHNLQKDRHVSKRPTKGVGSDVRDREGLGQKMNASYRGVDLDKMDLHATVVVRDMMYRLACLLHSGDYCGVMNGSISSPPCLAVLDAIWVMPGWAAAVEVLQRGQHHPTQLDDINRISSIAWRSLELLLSNNTVTMPCSEMSSLAATMRKLLWPHSQQGERPCVSSTREKGAGWLRQDFEQCSNQQTTGFNAVNYIVHSLLSSVRQLEWYLVACRTHMNTSNISNDGSNSARGDMCISNARATGIEADSHVSGACTPAYVPQDDSRNKATIDEEFCLPALSIFHRHQAIVLVTLSQVCLLRVQCSTHPATEFPEFVEVISVCERLCDPELQAVMVSLLDVSSMSQPRAEERLSHAWGRYAMTHFDGRLLLGCCHLGCTNLGGVSEASLKTQLCSGCRRARYCSVECQKAAWVAGGHWTLCGEQAGKAAVLR